ncbi:hypothetical protein Dxin01_02176 [Deinococcus xinjiangensis]|uniref:SCP domain-containing protein n=1 Tax=Deinococcus xinjiangensis TaxID=457454 RepID=A0ABP9VFD9_9DEIO
MRPSFSTSISTLSLVCLLSAALLTGCGGDTTKPPVTPTISVTTAALTLPQSGSSSLSLSFSAAPDRVDVTGQPSGLSAALSGNLLTLTAQNVTAGAYTLTLTGVWGSQKASANLQLTVSPSSGGYTWYVGTDRAASAEELEVLRLTNAVRASGATCGGKSYPPAPPLTWNDQLAHAARNHSTDMGTRNYFDHNTPEGLEFSDRITAAVYKWRIAAENIAAGYPTPKAVVDGWVASTGHCVNLMNASLKEIGIGGVTVSGSLYNIYWTQDFGTGY